MNIETAILKFHIFLHMTSVPSRVDLQNTSMHFPRYLIFFDDGYAQYVNHPDIRVVTEASACSWEDVSSDSREFIKEYLQMYPERPMVRLQKWNYVKTEWNGECSSSFLHQSSYFYREIIHL